MKKLTAMLCAVATVMFVFTTASFAADAGKVVTLEGAGNCAHCDLNLSNKCASVITIKDGDKTKIYYVTKNKAAKAVKLKNGKAVIAKGVVTEKDGKLYLTATEITAK